MLAHGNNYSHFYDSRLLYTCESHFFLRNNYFPMNNCWYAITIPADCLTLSFDNFIPFKNDFDKYPLLWEGLERSLCPRIHFKILIFDLHTVYIGSANLTGAALGMKSKKNRNFEAGIFTDEPELVENAIAQFDKVWIGKYCKDCGRKNVCKDRIRLY